MRHRRWLEATIRHCEKSGFPTFRMAALIVKGGRVVEVAVNKSEPARTKVKTFEEWHSMHAEMHVIWRMLHRNPKMLYRAIMYVAGVRSNTGNLLLSKPCRWCEHELRQLTTKYGLRKVFYHEKDGTCKELQLSAA